MTNEVERRAGNLDDKTTSGFERAFAGGGRGGFPRRLARSGWNTDDPLGQRRLDLCRFQKRGDFPGEVEPGGASRSGWANQRPTVERPPRPRSGSVRPPTTPCASAAKRRGTRRNAENGGLGEGRAWRRGEGVRKRVGTAPRIPMIRPRDDAGQSPASPIRVGSARIAIRSSPPLSPMFAP